MIVTTIEQSKHLIELGLNPDNADMWWTIVQPLKYYGWQLIPDGESYSTLSLYKKDHIALANYEDIPAWSLSALMGLVHEWYIHAPNPMCEDYCCRLSREEQEFYAETPIDAVYEMICWLLENKKI